SRGDPRAQIVTENHSGSGQVLLDIAEDLRHWTLQPKEFSHRSIPVVGGSSTVSRWPPSAPGPRRTLGFTRPLAFEGQWGSSYLASSVSSGSSLVVAVDLLYLVGPAERGRRVKIIPANLCL